MPERNFSYALFMALALGVFLLARRCLPRTSSMRRLTWQQRLEIALAAFVGGVVGGKLPFVFSSNEPWWSGAAWFADGKTITTGLMGAYLAVEVMKLILGVRVKTGDSFALPLALAMVIGRFGCFTHGCCYGTPTDLPWGVDFGDGIPRHPTQVYESLFHFGMAVMLFFLTVYDRLKYQRLKFYLIGYSIYRFLTEYIRPEPRDAFGLTFYQWAAIVLAIGMIAQWVFDERGKWREQNLIAIPVDDSPSLAKRFTPEDIATNRIR